MRVGHLENPAGMAKPGGQRRAPGDRIDYEQGPGMIFGSVEESKAEKQAVFLGLNFV